MKKSIDSFKNDNKGKEDHAAKEKLKELEHKLKKAEDEEKANEKKINDAKEKEDHVS